LDTRPLTLPFVVLDPALLAALEASDVVVPNRRLRDLLMRAYDDRQRAAGRTAWRTPRVETLDEHFVRLFHESSSASLELHRTRLLDAQAERAVWMAVARTSGDEIPRDHADLEAAWRTACHHGLRDRLAG
jgi:hypothetical protein